MRTALDAFADKVCKPYALSCGLNGFVCGATRKPATVAPNRTSVHAHPLWILRNSPLP